MSYGFGFGFPRLASLAAAGSPFATLGPTLDLNFVGTGSSSGVPGDNDSLDLNFVGNAYSVGTQYSVWTSGGLQPENFQDIVTYSRSTTNATYYNSSGYLTTTGILNYLTYSNTPENAAWTKSNSFIQTNLLTYSEQFNNPAWSKAFSTVTSNATIAPNGTLTADKIIVNAGIVLGSSTGAGVRQDIVKSASAITYTQSFYAKAGEFDSVFLFMSNLAASAAAYVKFNLVNGTYSNLTASGFLSVSASIISVGNGWYRCIITATSDTDTGMRNSVFPADSVATVGDGVSGIYIWGAQLVQGSVPGNYQATTAAALPVLYADWTGALTARKLCEAATTSAHFVSQSVTVTGSSNFTDSIYVKAGERTSCRVINYDAGANYAFIYVDLNNGNILTSGVVGTGSGQSFTVTSVGNGWYRIAVSVSLAATTRQLRIDTAIAGNEVYTGDGSSGIYIADAQLELGTSVGPYYETTQYVYNAPRFDYDPVTLQPRGLLIEELRTNLLLQSNDFQTSWGVTNITRTLNATLSPDGNINGVKIEATGAAATTVLQAATVAATSATGSVYVKQGTSATVANSFVLKNGTTATNLVAGTLNYSTGVFTYVIGSSGVVVTNVGNGWWRIAITATTGITSGDSIQWFVGWGGAIATAGDFLYAYGAQLEAGAFATSYIPTVASQVTRAADAASVNTMTPWFNPSAGALYAEFATYGYSTLFYPCAAQIGFNGVGSRGYIHVINGPTATTSFNVFDDAFVYQGPTSSVAYVTGAIRKQAGAYRVNDAAGTADGVAAVTDTSVTLPTNLNVLTIGCYANFGSQNQINGWVRRVTYYPRRLTNAELQSITTL